MATAAFDIFSKHYADASSDLRSDSYPVLNDEYAHIPCYDLDTLRRDPGVRNFWGESIQRFGDKFLAAEGCLGGSIWAGIDEVFLMPEGPAGYGPWGIIDGWRREKPEYWLTRKAYSPIRVEAAPGGSGERKRSDRSGRERVRSYQSARCGDPLDGGRGLGAPASDRCGPASIGLP